MSGVFRHFQSLIHYAATGLLPHIPYVGPVLQSVLSDMRQDRPLAELRAELQRLSRLLESGASLPTTGVTAEQLASDLSVIVRDEHNPQLASALLLAEAEAGKRLAVEGTPPVEGGGGPLNRPTAGRTTQQRFLYLAADNYASATRTLQIAAEHGFLWRSYHADGGAAVSNVASIRTGDLIALAYRLPNQFRLLAALIVTASGEHTLPIDDAQCPRHHAHAPFMLADQWLTQILQQEGYGADPVFHKHSGLNVKPLLVTQVPEELFPSPGMNTVWPYLRMRQGTTTYYLPAEVRDWIAQLCPTLPGSA